MCQNILMSTLGYESLIQYIETFTWQIMDTWKELTDGKLLIPRGTPPIPELGANLSIRGYAAQYFCNKDLPSN